MNEIFKKPTMHIYFLKITSLITIFYFSLNTTIERNLYPISIKTLPSAEFTPKNKNVGSETENGYKIRRKILIDLKYHLVKKNANKENVIHVILNQEGKILGYKSCSIFYPNYFTKIQPQSVLKTNKTFKKNKTNLCLIKLKSL